MEALHNPHRQCSPFTTNPNEEKGIGQDKAGGVVTIKICYCNTGELDPPTPHSLLQSMFASRLTLASSNCWHIVLCRWDSKHTWISEAPPSYLPCECKCVGACVHVISWCMYV